jgi:glutamine synthetase
MRFLSLYHNTSKLENMLISAKDIDDITKRAVYYQGSIIPVMQKLRESTDGLESETDAKLWPVPVYSQILFSV